MLSTQLLVGAIVASQLALGFNRPGHRLARGPVPARGGRLPARHDHAGYHEWCRRCPERTRPRRPRDTELVIHDQRASTATTTSPVEVDEPTDDTVTDPDTPWVVLVWNDPINLMQYVTFVFQKLFGYSLDKATELMLDVHHKGRAVVSTGPREKAELDVFRLHEHGLWATMQQD